MTHTLTSTPFLSFTYGRDKVGQVVTNTERADTHTYTYDPYRMVGELITSTTNVSNTWSLDAATQIKQTTSQPTGGTPITTTRSYDNANQLLSFIEKQGATTTKSLTFTFDLMGTRTQQRDSVSSQAISFTHDQLNELIDYNGVAQYRYSGDGLRMQKTQGGSTTNFAWDELPGLPLLLQDGSASFIYGPGGMPLEEVTNTGSVYYYHMDQLGSIRALTDGSENIANTYSYDAYGKPSSTGSAYNPFGYTGQYVDNESGLVYLRARYYDPATQQFVELDPIVGITGQAYNYANGNPTNLVDPTGLGVCDFVFNYWFGIRGPGCGGVVYNHSSHPVYVYGAYQFGLDKNTKTWNRSGRAVLYPGQSTLDMRDEQGRPIAMWDVDAVGSAAPSQCSANLKAAGDTIFSSIGGQDGATETYSPLVGRNEGYAYSFSNSDSADIYDVPRHPGDLVTDPLVEVSLSMKDIGVIIKPFLLGHDPFGWHPSNHFDEGYLGDGTQAGSGGSSGGTRISGP